MSSDNNIEQVDPEDARLALFLWIALRSRAYRKIDLSWTKLSEEITCSNRFFPSRRSYDFIDRYVAACETELTSGTVLFRARKTLPDKAGLINVFESVFDSAFPDISGKGMLFEGLPPEDSLKLASLFRVDGLDTRIHEFEEKAKELEPFYGLSEADSGAPPAKLASGGRANPRGIPYLYIAEEEATAIAETRPSLGEVVSVAEVETTRPMRLFDLLSKPPMQDDGKTDFDAGFELEFMSNEFSRLSSGSPEDYLPTQFVCEYLKSLGFDGIRYKSSICVNGINIALFDTSVESRGYIIRSSRAVVIRGSEIKYDDFVFQDRPPGVLGF